jgi:hypothetical protein
VTASLTAYREGLIGWEGTLEGMTETDQNRALEELELRLDKRNLVGQQSELRLSNGRTATVYLESGTSVEGLGSPPF